MPRASRAIPSQAQSLSVSDELASLRFSFRIAGSVKCGSGWSIPLAQQPQHRLIVVRGGVGELVREAGPVPLRRGHVVFGQPGDVYGIRQHPQRRLVVSITRFEVYDGVQKLPALPATFLVPIHSQVRCFPLLEQLMVRLTNAVASTPCWAEGLSASLLRSALWLIREDQHSGDNLQLKNAVHESLRPVLRYEPAAGEREPAIRDLARLCGVSVSTLTRRMRANQGLSPKSLLIRKRIERAKMLLLESPHSIHAIAAELGYREPGHFTRQFQAWVGLTPSAFRSFDR